MAAIGDCWEAGSWEVDSWEADSWEDSGAAPASPTVFRDRSVKWLWRPERKWPMMRVSVLVHYDFILLETGDFLLTETGDRLIL